MAGLKTFSAFVAKIFFAEILFFILIFFLVFEFCEMSAAARGGRAGSGVSGMRAERVGRGDGENDLGVLGVFDLLNVFKIK